MQKSTLAQRIRAARRRRGLTQDAVAAHFGVTRSAVTMWESPNANIRTRPDLSRLEAFARLTRTPVWWLLSDESDPDQPWPEIAEESPAAAERGANSWLHYARSFWASVSLRCREQRPDLWDAEIWEPTGPTWLRSLLPDVVTQRSAVELVSVSRPSMAKIAEAMARLVAFEKVSTTMFGASHERLTVLIWLPEKGPGTHMPPAQYTQELEQLYTLAQSLAQALGVTYYVVRTDTEAIAYLTQIL